MVEAGRVTAWTRRQFKSDSSTDRVRKHRAVKRTGELMSGHAVEPAADKTAGERFATVPYSHSETEPEVLNLSPPSGPARDPQAAGDGFERFWQAMPLPAPATRAAAQAAFARLDAAAQAQAIAAASRYASAFAAKPTTHPISPARFLRERCFGGYGASSPGGGTAPAVFVRLNTPQ